jgi:hypothetical protein
MLFFFYFFFEFINFFFLNYRFNLIVETEVIFFHCDFIKYFEKKLKFMVVVCDTRVKNNNNNSHEFSLNRQKKKLKMSSRATRLRSDKYNANVTKRGKVVSKEPRDNDYTVSPLLLGFFFFVLVGRFRIF